MTENYEAYRRLCLDHANCGRCPACGGSVCHYSDCRVMKYEAARENRRLNPGPSADNYLAGVGYLCYELDREIERAI